MSWILPSAEAIPSGGVVRNLGRFDRRAYDRAYYHAKRKGLLQKRTPEQAKRASERRMKQYYANVDRERANARARYWANRDRYAEASRLRQAALRASA